MIAANYPNHPDYTLLDFEIQKRFKEIDTLIGLFYDKLPVLQKLDPHSLKKRIGEIQILSQEIHQASVRIMTFANDHFFPNTKNVHRKDMGNLEYWDWEEWIDDTIRKMKITGYNIGETDIKLEKLKIQAAESEKLPSIDEISNLYNIAKELTIQCDILSKKETSNETEIIFNLAEKSVNDFLNYINELDVNPMLNKMDQRERNALIFFAKKYHEAMEEHVQKLQQIREDFLKLHVGENV